MINYDIFSELGSQIENVLIKDYGKHFHGRCPFCGDSKKNKNKKRFHLKYNNGNPGFNCFNCGVHGSFIELYSYMKGISIHETIKILNKFDIKDIKNRLKTKKNKKETIKKPDFKWILKDCISDDKNTNSLYLNRYIKYIKDFKIKRKIPKEKKIYFAYKGEYEGRIIIPIFENKKLIYFQARAISNNIEPKYKNPPLNNLSFRKENIIYNYKNFNKNKPIIITEGLLDTISIGNQSTTILGSSITNNFIDNLLKLTNKYLILAYDNDKKGLKELTNFLINSEYSKIMKYFLMPNELKIYKDLNEVLIDDKNNINNRNELYNIVLDNSYNKLTTLTMLKLGEKNENS